jgi:TRAP-type C4-dicarboxylate transport system permease small subunit
MAALARSAPPELAARRADALFAAARGFGTLVGCAFGYSLVALAVIVTVEAVGRKLVGFSIQGADELGGYILAFGSSLCFSTALVERGHIRIDIFHAMFPRALRIALDWVSIVTMAVFAVMIAWLAWVQLADSIDYGSTAPTPWATPLVYPMSLWVAALAVFALLALAFALHATQLLVGGRVRELEKRYGPKEAEEEIREELADLERR